MSRQRAIWLMLGFLGLALLIPFESPVTLTLGVLLLIAFVAYGVFLIATPAFLAENPDSENDNSPSEPG